jgi:hypothetical protein
MLINSHRFIAAFLPATTFIYWIVLCRGGSVRLAHTEWNIAEDRSNFPDAGHYGPEIGDRIPAELFAGQ